MSRELIQFLWEDRRIRYTILGGLILQLIISFTAMGFYHPDQHFQLVEFSSWQLGRENGATKVWEYEHYVRPSLQVYLFTAYRLLMESLSIMDPYMQMTILRLLQGLALFVLFHLIVFHYFKKEDSQLLWWVLLILNLSWFLPYTRTLFNSEMISAAVFFGTLVWYDAWKDKKPGFAFLILIGLLYAMAFYLRFQIGFALVGLGVWFLLYRRYLPHLIPLAIGFALGFLVNAWLDRQFYHEWVITPYTYFYTNIIEKRAASFGTSSFLMYIGWLAGVLTAPFFSLVLIYYIFKAWRIQIRQPLFLASFFFVLAHCLVGHKEERFIFTVFNILPVLAGWGLPDLRRFYGSAKSGSRRFLKILLGSTLVLNTLLMLVLVTTPYSQTVYFSWILKNKFKSGPVTLYCFERTPFETPNKAQMIFYRKGVKSISIVRVTQIDSLQYLNEPGTWVATTFNNIRKHRKEIHSLGFKPVTYSSGLLWGINEFLDRIGLKNTIEDIWVLYRKMPS